ncbi:uncharacterized protein LOC131637548 [Vicia villosa]|uniref:uncharacterized protein LOC131637548 n=1 Tax=Vicia villosa TaxID=3911 RepID=UPI00273B2F18|nr:uncharacterized protein LOC131637548 [Vicia villosa]
MYTTEEIDANLTKAFSSLQDQSYKAIERNASRKDKPAAKIASGMTTSSSQGISTDEVAPKITKQAKGSGKPPVTPNKRKKSSGDAAVEEQEEIASPKKKGKKQKKHKATVSSYQATNAASVQLKIVPPSPKESQPRPSGNLVLEYIESNASEPDTQPETTVIPTANNQGAPSHEGNQSPPQSNVAHNKGSSTGAPLFERIDAQQEPEIYSPVEDMETDAAYGQEANSGDEDSEETSNNLPLHANLPRNYDDDQSTGDAEHTSKQNERTIEKEVAPEVNQDSLDETAATNITQTNPTQTAATHNSTLSLTEEELITMKHKDPLEYVRLMMAQRESSSKKSMYGASTPSGTSASETFYDDLLKQVKESIFEVDFFEKLKIEVSASSSIKKLIGKINITACPSDVGETHIDIPNLINQVQAERNREVDATVQIKSIERAKSTEFDEARVAYEASKKLLTDQ